MNIIDAGLRALLATDPVLVGLDVFVSERGDLPSNFRGKYLVYRDVSQRPERHQQGIGWRDVVYFLQAGIQSRNIADAEAILDRALVLLNEHPYAIELASGHLMSIFWRQRTPSPPTQAASVVYQELTDRYDLQYAA